MFDLTYKQVTGAADASDARARKMLMVALIGAIGIGGIAFDAVAAQCGGLHKLRVTDLDMSPDPVRQGQHIKTFKLTLYADGNGECVTTVRITDRDQVASEQTVRTLRSGPNVITLPAKSAYRMQNQDHCFTVEADIQRSPQRVDADRRFCATAQGASWTLRERGDATRPQNPRGERIDAGAEGRAVGR